MAKKELDEITKELCLGLSLLDTPEKISLFLKDVCTISEMQEMSRRLTAAKMLKENTIYTVIAEKTGLSTATISRVNQCLKYGDGGYDLVLNLLKQEENE